MCHVHACAQRVQEKMLDPLELEFKTIVRHQMNAWNGTQVFCKRSKSSSTPSPQPWMGVFSVTWALISGCATENPVFSYRTVHLACSVAF